MSDYSQVVDYSAKDALSSGDPNKLVKGSDVDSDLTAISSAIATKYDSADIASQASAEAGTSNAGIMTPLRTEQHVANYVAENGGMLLDIHDLADPGADVLLGWDESANDVIGFTLGSLLSHAGTEINVDESSINHDSLASFAADEHVAHSGVTLTAGTGLSGGGTIDANRTFTLDLTELTAKTVTDAIDLDVDTIAGLDSTAQRKIAAASLVTPEMGTTVSGTTYALDEADFGKITNYSSTSTITVTLPNSLKTGFWAVIRKTGVSGTLTISASGTLQVKGTATDVTDQYGVITVFHLGSNVWTAWGDIT